MYKIGEIVSSVNFTEQDSTLTNKDKFVIIEVKEKLELTDLYNAGSTIYIMTARKLTKRGDDNIHGLRISWTTNNTSPLFIRPEEIFKHGWKTQFFI